jgi:hypothetical protein
VERRFVPAKLHGLLDFLTMGLFFAGGEVFSIKEAPASTVPSQVMGAALALYCPLTDYGADRPFGGVRALSMKQHLVLDIAFVLPVGLSPWIFGTWRKGWNYWAPQTFAMASEVFFGLTTKTDAD